MKKILNIQEDKFYSIIEFEDHTFKVMVEVNQLKNIIDYLLDQVKNNEKKCICCNRTNISLCNLNDKEYICLDCTTKIIEMFARNGEIINININNISTKMAKKIKNFIEGNIKSNNVIYKIKETEFVNE